MTFELLEVSKEIVKALKEDGIYEPTKIQKLAIPHILKGKDVIGMSNTGSGKTVAFGVPVLDNINPHDGLQTLILAPTRELAVQISKELKKFAKYIHCNIATVYGGVSIEPQMNAIQKAHIVVGTTGRICDHLQRRTLNLSKLKCVILDEADKMVEMGFIEDIEIILNEINGKKQVLLFGATISDEINHIKRKHMDNPETAQAEIHVKEDLLGQYYYDVRPGEKFSLLVHLLKKEKTRRSIIFCATRATVETLTKNLKANGVKVSMIHGKLSQNKRQRCIDEFNKGRPNVLVASAVAARGLDIRDVSHVFNYGLSKDPQEYVHRVGRTARAGESGVAITLLEPKDHEAFGQILNRYGMNIELLPEETFPRLNFAAGPRRRGFRGGRGGSRGHSRGSSRGGSSGSRNSGRSNSGGSRGFRSGGRSSSGGSRDGSSGFRSGGRSGGGSSGRPRSGNRSGGSRGGSRSSGGRNRS